MNLLCGVPGDTPLDAVHDALLRRDARTMLIDQRRLQDVTLEFDIGESISGALRIGDRSVALEAITGMYLRPHDRATLSSPTDEATASCTAAARDSELDNAFQILAQLTPALVLNRPDAMAANGSKPYQSAQIQAVGFQVPDTLITTSPDAAREFLAHHRRIIYKSISGVRSIVGELSDIDSARLDEVTWCPTQLQESVAGVDVRVHVVGHRLFACEVRSRAVDYRYATLSGHTVTLSRYNLPDDCAERCLALSRVTELPLTGIDLRRTPDGGWYCFEANPSPAFTYYQQATGHPIDEAIAEFLIHGPTPSTGPHHRTIALGDHG